ncbi:hypothetical protein VVD49_05715 [Uliginosibacterium sp. H3]|uniref:Uncharacterized protein n=1 Tax=Uliginosibacterium silvisoli TaxID=3114758 RepID=A0ABU6K0R1_9RHOO|nr:hypothetical protein [Uliginosibacterium sp. H3]
MQASTAYVSHAGATRLRPFRALLAWLSLAVMAACVAIPVSRYDAGTYAHLTSLKAETAVLLESFDSKPVKANEARIDEVSLSLRKAYEYERGKGADNRDTTAQLTRILDLFKEDVSTYRENGPGTLGKRYFSEAAIVLEQAFDIVIASENAKNKDRRQAP